MKPTKQSGIDLKIVAGIFFWCFLWVVYLGGSYAYAQSQSPQSSAPVLGLLEARCCQDGAQCDAWQLQIPHPMAPQDLDQLCFVTLVSKSDPDDLGVLYVWSHESDTCARNCPAILTRLGVVKKVRRAVDGFYFQDTDQCLPCSSSSSFVTGERGGDFTAAGGTVE